jgi:hypothetical protein
MNNKEKIKKIKSTKNVENFAFPVFKKFLRLYNKSDVRLSFFDAERVGGERPPLGDVQ